MATATAKPKAKKRADRQIRKDPRERLVRELKAWVTEKHEAEKRAEGLAPRIWKNVYEYIEYSVTCQEARTKHQAAELLAPIVGMPKNSVEKAHYYGQFMRDLELKVGDFTPTALTTLYEAWNAMSKWEQGKAVDMLWDKCSMGDMLRHTRRCKGVFRREVNRKIKRLVKNKQLNAQRMKMEAMAYQTMADTFYGKHVTISVFDAESGDILLEVE